MRRSLNVHAAIFIAAGLCVTGIPSHAQDPAGVEVGADLSFGIRYVDEEFRAQTGLGVSFNSTTRTQSLGFSLQTAIETTGTGDSLEAVDPTLLLTYDRVGANASLETSASIQRSQISDLVIDDTTTSDEVLTTTGSREKAEVAAKLTFGTVSPVGGEIDLGLRRVTYTDAPTLNDFDTRRAGLTLRFSVDPRIDLRATANYQETQADAVGTSRISQSIGVGVDVLHSETVRSEIDLKFTDIESSVFGIPTAKASGPALSIRTVRMTRTGEYRFDLSTQVTGDGNRVEAEIGQEINFQRGSLEWSAGLSHGDDDETNAIFSLNYGQQTRTADFSVSVAREIRSDAFGEELLSNQLRLKYGRALSENSRFESGLGYRDIEFLNSMSDDVRKLELSLSYRYAFTRDVDLVAEVSHSTTWTGSLDGDDENTLYLGVQRGFTWRP